jgi:two-component system CheB/CheR fusion protein
MRIRPYKTAENKLYGVVIVLIDIDDIKRNQPLTEYASYIMDTVQESILILDKHLSVKYANRFFYNTFRVRPKEVDNKYIYDMGNGQWNIPKLKTLLESVLVNDSNFEYFEVEHEFPHIGFKKMLLNARQLYREDKKLLMILLSIKEATNNVITGSIDIS